MRLFRIIKIKFGHSRMAGMAGQHRKRRPMASRCIALFSCPAFLTACHRVQPSCCQRRPRNIRLPFVAPNINSDSRVIDRCLLVRHVSLGFCFCSSFAAAAAIPNFRNTIFWKSASSLGNYHKFSGFVFSFFRFIYFAK